MRPGPATPTDSAASLAFGDFVLDIAAQRLTQHGRPVALAPRYFAVLQHLAATGGRLVGKDELLDAVWGHRHVSDSVLKVAMNALRKALDDDPKAPQFIETVARKGYRFVGVQRLQAAQAVQPAAPEALPPAADVVYQRLGNLPAEQPGLIGRDTDVRRLLEVLAQHRLVTLHGPGDVGKTRLALAACAAVDAPADGVWLLRLDAMADAAPLLPSLARMLSLGAGADAEPTTLARALGGLELLLLLDNAEHMLEGVAAVAMAVLAAAPGVRMVVTSQVPLRVAGEQVLPLAPLGLPTPDEPQAADSAALRLLLARVRQQHPEARLGAAALADAGAICRALDGLPLALELAAARVPLLGWAGVRARLLAQPDISLALLNHGPAGAAERQRTLVGALQWACDLLSPAQHRVLRCLSVFAGSFSVDAAVAVAAEHGDADALLDHLDALREHALLVRVDAGDAPPRWRLFDSVRSFAAQALTASCERDAALRRLLKHLNWQFSAALTPYFKLPLRDWVATLEPESDNLRRALQWALTEPVLHTLGVALFAASILFRLRAGWRADALLDLRVLQAKQASAAVPLDPLLQAELDLAMAALCVFAQAVPPNQALDCARRAQAPFRAVGDIERESMALYMEGLCMVRMQGMFAERQRNIERLQASEPPHWTAMQRRQRVWLSISLQRDQGDLAGHDAGCAAYMALGRAVGDDNLVWVGAQSLAQTLYAEGREDEATALLGRTVQGMRAAGQLRANAHVLSQWAAARMGQEHTPQTVGALHEAARLMQAEGRLWWMADALAWPLAWRGQWDDAARIQAWADGLVRQRGDQRGRLFGGLRKRFGDWLEQQPQTDALRGLLAADPEWDEPTVLSVVFGRDSGL